ncbi:MAG: lytic murein transglycosylase, partial [Proteobacteria bacterium]|nr:lytic murein transglycosylase [Candidatus Enterousia avistercoris]
MTAGLVADIKLIQETRATAQNTPTTDPNAIDTDVAPQPVIYAYLTYPNFYRIKKWNSSNWYAIAIATLADELK